MEKVTINLIPEATAKVLPDEKKEFETASEATQVLLDIYLKTPVPLACKDLNEVRILSLVLSRSLVASRDIIILENNKDAFMKSVDAILNINQSN